MIPGAVVPEMIFTKSRRNYSFVFIFLSAVFFANLCHGKFIDSLSYEDLPGLLKSAPTLLVFTVSWCQHCSQVLPEVALIAKAVKNSPDINVARVDADEEPAIVTKFHVESFPTFLYLPAGFSLKEKKEPEEFTDYRWAELLAEFVNNETQTETVKIAPRKKFLEWRKKVPYNKGKQPRQMRVALNAPTPHPDGLDPIVGAEDAGLTIRDPIVLTHANFEEVVKNVKEATVVYFYSRHDFMQRDFLIQWRQASSAYTKEDHVTLAMINIDNEGNDVISEKYNITDTPSIMYFARCNAGRKKKPVEECKKPAFCEDCPDTDRIIDFINDQSMIEMGVDPKTASSTGSEIGEGMVTLTDEEYNKLVKEGKIYPLDPNSMSEDGDNSSPSSAEESIDDSTGNTEQSKNEKVVESSGPDPTEQKEEL